MTENLDTLVSRAVYAAALLERALHNPTGWTVSYGPHEIPMERRVTEDGVTFRGTVPETCWLDAPTNVVLRHDGQVVGVRAIDHPGDCGFDIDWSLALSTRTEVA